MERAASARMTEAEREEVSDLALRAL